MIIDLAKYRDVKKDEFSLSYSNHRAMLSGKKIKLLPESKMAMDAAAIALTERSPHPDSLLSRRPGQMLKKLAESKNELWG